MTRENLQYATVQLASLLRLPKPGKCVEFFGSSQCEYHFAVSLLRRPWMEFLGIWHLPKLPPEQPLVYPLFRVVPRKEVALVRSRGVPAKIIELAGPAGPCGRPAVL